MRTAHSKPDVHTSQTLPRGIIYRHRPDRAPNQHHFGVRDKGVNTYRRQSFTDYAKGLAWAKGYHRSIDIGEATALRPLLSEIGPAYLEKLAIRGSSPRYIAQVERAIDQLRHLGANDMSADRFPIQVQGWLNAMKGHQKHMPASPRSKRRNLTMVRAVIHLAMKLPSRPLRYDPLLTIAVPRIERHDKPVFTVQELRILVSERSRRASALRQQALGETLASSGGDRRAAAKILGIHVSTVYNQLGRTAVPTDDPWWLYTCLAIYTGARPAEVQAMCWEWIDWRQDCIIIPANAPGNKLRLERVVPLQRELREVLIELVTEGANGNILDPRIARLDVSPRALQFKRYCGRCGVPPGSRGPHSLRHNHGAICVAMRMHPELSMLYMGHDNAKISMSYKRTAPRYRMDVIGWYDDFYLRRDPPVSNLIPRTVIPAIIAESL